MSRKLRLSWSVLLAIFGCTVLLCAQGAPRQKLDAIYQSAVADYNAGHFPQAAHQLETILPDTPKSFAVHELLGLVYASMSQNAKALNHLQIGVQLSPDSAVARTNLGAMLLHAGKANQAAEEFRKALQLEPANYVANHNLGELYAKSGHVAEAQPLLQAAYRMKPEAYGNGYDLAMADFMLGRLDEARQVIQELEKRNNTGELHNLLAQIDEKQGNFIEAANEYQTAAHLDPTENNLFDWGSEMLLHRTYEPAITIFQTAVKRYPNSARLQIGLGLTLYSRDRYDEAVKILLKAVALSPGDPRCYYFLSKAYDDSPSQASEVIQVFRRYAASHPRNALAQYYYAVSLWKGRREQGSAPNLDEVEALLKKAIALEPKLVEAHLQLGALYAGQRMYARSVSEYERALALDPNQSDARYRLGTDYVHLGQKEEAQKEFAIYQKLRAQHLAKLDKERAMVKQFLYSAKAAAGNR